jgi:glyoxylase-like metal-dependent hydrolase (beta-lactamase superfamily II)
VSSDRDTEVADGRQDPGTSDVAVGQAASDVVPSEIKVTGLAQRQAWLDRDLPPIEQLSTDLWSIPVPIPNNPLRYTSAYVLAGPSGLTLIDTGWETDGGWEALVSGLAKIGGSITDVRGVLVTHMHFDHIGLAGRIREASGAWIALHAADRDVLAHPEYRVPENAFARRVAWLRYLGAPQEEIATLTRQGDSFERMSRIALPDRLLGDGQRADVPGWSLLAVHTPGHTPGHLCFADEERRLFFAGDHILPRITPNISAGPLGHHDPLGQFLSSLRAVRARQAEEVMPAHEWRFQGLTERVDQLLAHHAGRLEETLRAVREHPGSVPWELASYLKWSRSWDQYNGHLRLSAVGETTAHLWHLVTLRQVVCTGDPGIYNPTTGASTSDL